MAERKQWNIAVQIKPREGGKGKPFWMNLGKAYETERGISLSLNCLPIRDASWDGGMMLFPDTRAPAPPQHDDDTDDLSY